MKIRRILVFNVNWLGDILFSTPTLKNIRCNFPKSFIACIIPSRGFPILKGNPHLDEIIIFDERDRHRSLLAKLSFVKFLKRKRFDIVFLLHRSFSRALICWLAGIPERVGYYTKKRKFLLSQKIISPDPNAVHRIDYYLNIIEKAGLRIEDRYPEFFISEEDLRVADDFLNKCAVKKDDFLVAINPGGNWLPKRWPSHYWARLSDKLISDLNAKVIITGAMSDMVLGREIKNLMLNEPILACGRLSLLEFGALCKRLRLFITADSGPLHIANALGTKRIIAIFGPTSPLVTGPYPLGNNIIILSKELDCKVPCYAQDCKDNRCMKAITPEEVIEKIKSFGI